MTLVPTRPLRPLNADELAALRRSGANSPTESTSNCRHCGGQIALGINGWTHLVGPRPHQVEPTIEMVVL